MTNFLLGEQEWCIDESTYGLGLNHGINTIILWVQFVMFSCLFQTISLLIHAYLNQESDSSWLGTLREPHIKFFKCKLKFHPLLITLIFLIILFIAVWF